MVTRAMRRKYPDLYWTAIEDIYVEIQGMGRCEARRNINGLRASYNACQKGYSGETQPFMQHVFLFAFTSSNWKIGKTAADPIHWHDFDNEFYLQDLYLKQNYDLIREIFERHFGVDGLAKRPDWLW